MMTETIDRHGLNITEFGGIYPFPGDPNRLLDLRITGKEHDILRKRLIVRLYKILAALEAQPDRVDHEMAYIESLLFVGNSASMAALTRRFDSIYDSPNVEDMQKMVEFTVKFFSDLDVKAQMSQL